MKLLEFLKRTWVVIGDQYLNSIVVMFMVHSAVLAVSTTFYLWWVLVTDTWTSGLVWVLKLQMAGMVLAVLSLLFLNAEKWAEFRAGTRVAYVSFALLLSMAFEVAMGVPTVVSKIQLGIDWSLFLIGYSFYLNYVKREEQC